MNNETKSFRLGTKISKPLTEEQQYFYSECAVWCNENEAMIEDKGDYYEVVPVPEPTEEDLATQARSKRDYLISETDYLLMPDYPISQESSEAVKVYRQALRDVPQQKLFPLEINWPEKPVIQKL